MVDKKLSDDDDDSPSQMIPSSTRSKMAFSKLLPIIFVTKKMSGQDSIVAVELIVAGHLYLIAAPGYRQGRICHISKFDFEY
jgi:hypothetical protein